MGQDLGEFWGRIWVSFGVGFGLGSVRVLNNIGVEGVLGKIWVSVGTCVEGVLDRVWGCCLEFRDLFLNDLGGVGIVLCIMLDVVSGGVEGRVLG